jgi:ankyrin repeat protein
MITRLCVYIILLAVSAAPAQTNSLTTLLQQGLFEEQANRNLDAAIADYQSLATQFDKDRQIAATAVFRLGECYRIQGKTNQAALQYQRILRDFSDQKALATLSRQNLAGLGATAPETAASGSAVAASAPTDDEEIEIRRIQEMIQNSPDLINGPGYGSTSAPLIQAALSDHLRVARYLLDHQARMDVRGASGVTPLTTAAACGHRAMVELLLSRGADVNTKGGGGGTALHQAAQHGFQAVAEVLLANKADVNARDDSGDTPLHSATWNGHARIVQMLLDAGANPNVEDNNGITPLSCAAQGRSPETVRILLAAKADPNDAQRDAPLLCAIHNQDASAAELLLRNGANPNAKGTVSWPDGTVRWPDSGNTRPTPLWLAISGNQLPMVQLLLKYKADPNETQTDGIPLLFSAVDKTDILRALLEAGAKADVRDTNRNSAARTPLDPAVRLNNAAAVELLLKHGADPNARDTDGNAALHSAAYRPADRKIFELLLNYKADPNVRNNQGTTPLDYLKQNNNKAAAGEIAEFLRQHGALDHLPNWDRIEVSRPSDNFSFTIFGKNTNDWNRFTLLETILNNYCQWGRGWGFPTARVAPGFPGVPWGPIPINSRMPFPDLSRIIIAHPSHDSTNEARIAVNLLNATNGIDCSKDVPLEFGDVVVIPERDHPLGDQPVGLTDSQRDTIVNYLKGNAQLAVRDQKAELPLYPVGDQSTIGVVLNKPEAQKLLLSSSDLSRVKVIRRDPNAGTRREWILDCATSPSDFRLRDGDVIEVPEKP